MSEKVWLAGIGPFGDIATLSALILGAKLPGTRHACPGCENQDEAWDERGWFLNTGLRLGGRDKIWSGAVAVIDPEVTLARPLPVPLIGLHSDQVSQCWQQILPKDVMLDDLPELPSEVGQQVMAPAGSCKGHALLRPFRRSSRANLVSTAHRPNRRCESELCQTMGTGPT